MLLVVKSDFVFAGHCSEKDHEPPRGLQLILGTKRMPHVVDTLVMANLGYWQMKLSPGVWYLQLAPGRSSDLYVLNDSNDDDQSYPLSKRIVINDLRGKLVHIAVKKKPGKEHEELLDASDDANPTERKKVDTRYLGLSVSYKEANVLLRSYFCAGK